MKRTLFLLLTMLLAISGFAQQTDTNKGMAKTMPFDKSLVKKPASERYLHKAPLRKVEEEAQTIDLTISGSYTFYFDVDEDEGTSDWYFSAYDDTGKYNVRLDYPAEYDGKYGTFTLDDIDKDYSYIKDFSGEEMEYRSYVEGTTFTVSEKNGKPHIEGTLVCDNGVTYNITFDHVPQTYTVEGTELTDIYYFSEDTDWYMRFNDGNYRICLDLNTGDEANFAGTYTEDDAIDGYNSATDLSTNSYDPFVSLNVKLALPEGITDPTRSCEITGQALSEHGDTYIFHMLKNPPITPVKTVDVDVELKTAEWPSKREDCKSYFELTEKDSEGESTGYKWLLGVNTLTGYANTDDIVDTLTYRINTATGDTIAFDNGSALLYFDSDNLCVNVEANLVMKDSIEYHFSFDYGVKVKGEVAYTFNNLTLNDNYYSSMGYQWLEAKNDEASMEITLTNAEVPGVYDDDNMSVQMAVRDADGEKSSVTSTAIISAYTSLDEHNQPVLNAKFYASNKRIYTIDAHFDIPAVADTLNISIDGLRANDLIDAARAFQIYGYNNDSTIYVSLVPEATQFEGHYTTEDLKEYRSYCVLAFENADGTYEQNDFYTADFDVTLEDKMVTLTGQFQAGAHFVNLTLKAKIRPQGIDYDSEDDPLDVAFTKEDLVSLESDNGYAYVELQNSSRSDIFAMLIYLDKFDDDIVIPEGVYEVNETYSAPSVQPGQMSSSGLYPTFYATLGNDGYLYTPFWFLTKGTVTVMKNEDNTMGFVVDGTNSYDCPIHVTYNCEGSGIQSIGNITKDNVIRKVVENNKIVIIKGERKYTTSGQALSY